MTHKDSFDKIWHDRFQEVETEVPHDMWQRINDNRKKQQPKRGLWKFGVLALLITAGSLGMWSYEHHQNSAAESLPETTAVSEHSVAVSNDHTTTTPPQKSTVAIEPPATTTAVTASIEKTPAIGIPPSTVPHHRKHIQQHRAATIATPPATIANNTHKTTVVLPMAKYSNNEEANNIHTIAELPLLASLLAKTLDNPAAAEHFLTLPDKRKDDFGCPQNMGHKKCSRWEAEVVFTPQWAQRHLKSEGTINNYTETNWNNYIAERKNTENPEISFTAGLRGGYRFCNGISLRTGLLFSQIQETFRYQKTEEVSVTTQTTITIVHPDGSTTVEVHNQQNQVEGIRAITAYNKHRFLDIPLLLGYETQWGKWTINAEAGLWYNIGYWNRGKMLNFNDSLTHDFDDLKYFDSRGSHLSISLGAQLQRPLRKNLLWYVEPLLRHQLYSINNNGRNPIYQNYSFFGIGGGIKMNF